MHAALLLLVALINVAQSVERPFVVTPSGFTGWFVGSTTANQAITVNAGDVIIFTVTTGTNHIFAIHTGTESAVDTAVTARVPTNPTTIPAGSIAVTMRLEVTEAMVGTALWYFCEVHDAMAGRIIVNACNRRANCAVGDCSGGICLTCAAGFTLTLDGSCTSGTLTCDVGQRRSGGVCVACKTCPSGQTLLTPCTGLTETDTVTCVDTSIDCPAGFVAREGICAPLYCEIFGCGYSALNIVCTEGTTFSYNCRCPNSNTATTVSVTSVGSTNGFSGCSGDRPTVTAVITRIDESHFEAFVANRLDEVSTLDITRQVGNELDFTIETSVPASQLEARLKSSIAAFIGNGVVSADVHLTFNVNKKRQSTYSTDVSATVDDNNDSPDTPDNNFPDSSAVVFSGLGSLLVAIFAALF